MLWLYNFGIFFYGLLIKVFALFNTKAKLFSEGRKEIFSVIEKKISRENRHIWFHFASLGEFEQGRPVLEKIKDAYPAKKIVITFFSPSGYEIRKNTPLADAVFYLPLDTASNAKRFIELLNPELVVFTKYEFWHHYFKTLHVKQIPLFLISGIFRPEQIFFKWYGGLYRKTLGYVTRFFVQNEESVQLLKSIRLQQVSLSGDTRFDRVAKNATIAVKTSLMNHFVQQNPVLVAGSTWAPDEALIAILMQKHPEWKLILAPHEIGKDHIDQIQQLFPTAVKYSQLSFQKEITAQTLIIDNIGLLSSLYQYGHISYIGGGFGAGIHNTLEAAAFGLPVIFGPRYEKFQEAKDLIQLQSAISINNAGELEQAFQTFNGNPEYGKAAKRYVDEKTGATSGILKEIEKYLD